ncbi:hypothetical protein CF319_g4766 [Tilletia indica]|uniref:Uncharacterized protein n=1 Tax=Tilletia indica TaxID=43049 RepID=A0A177TCK9_9BASI|nr:hypothetical protein CF319_g4766 [Tilletia indica]KAE8229294.1 hypothetical protein CF326_g5738 [Tilletia indica]KAE8250964.1 hypothetical protein A4X13_0g4224 [Tilletia indica]
MIPFIDETLLANLTKGEAAINTFGLARGNISWDLRGTILDWLAKVHDQLNLPADVLWHAHDCFHRYIATGRNIDPNAFLSALTCLWVAAKYEDSKRLRLKKIARFIGDDKDVRKRMIDEERVLLAALHYRLSAHTSPTLWVEYMCAPGTVGFPHKRLASVVLAAIASEPWFATIPSKTLAATATLVAVKMCGATWSPRFIARCGFEDQDILPYATQMILYLQSDDYTETWMFTKYAHPNYGELAHHVREWALQNVF